MANVPIVTDVTKVQLDALVAANGLNEGLQYNVTDKGWLLVASSNSTYKFASIPYKSYAAFLNQTGIGDPTATVLHNEIGDIVWSRSSVGTSMGTLAGAFGTTKTAIITGTSFNFSSGVTNVITSILADYVLITTIDAATDPADGELADTFIEIRVYLI